MSYPINYPTPQSADVQIFRVGTSDWIKPQGCSFVFALLVSAGGNGAGGTTSAGGGGGGSGGVMTALIPAFLMPDQVRVFVPAGGAGSGANGARLIYQAKDVLGYDLFAQSNGANATTSIGGNNAAASAIISFGAACIAQSVGGQGGSNAGVNLPAPSNTFLTGGSGGGSTTTTSGGTVITNYGFPTLAGGVGTTGGNGRNGVSILSNLIVSQGGSGGGGSTTATGGTGGSAGFGSGGGGGGICTTDTSTGGKGGDGLIVLISW